MQIPFVGFQPVRTSEHMASAGVFALLQAYAFLKYLQGFVSKSQLKTFFITAIIGFAGLVFLSVVALTYAGYIAPWSGRFYSLWDTGYAKIHIPIIASVSEHQPTTWFSFFFDLHVLVTAFPAGLWYCIREVNDERVFSKFFSNIFFPSKLILNFISTKKQTVTLYAITASYFAGVMVRLMLTFTPVVCVLSAIAFSECFSGCLMDKDKEKPSSTNSGSSSTSSKSKQQIDDDQKNGQKNLYDKAGKIRKIRSEPKETDSLSANLRTIASVLLIMLLMLFVVHCTWVTSNAYSSPSIVLASYGGDGYVFCIISIFILINQII